MKTKTPIKTLLLPTLVIGLSGCSSADREFEALVSEHSSNLDDLRRQSDEHRARIGDTEDLARLAEIESEYHAQMTERIEEMRGTMERMEACAHVCCFGGNRMMRSMMEELDVHHLRMTSIADLANARAEEERHQRMMGAEFGDMDGDNREMHHMMNMGIDMGCPGEDS